MSSSNQLTRSLPEDLVIAEAIDRARTTRDPLRRFPLARKPTVTNLDVLKAPEALEPVVSEAPPKQVQATLLDTQRKQILKEEFATVNPFINETEGLSPYEWFKIVLFTVTLIAPLRILLCILIFLIMALFSAISISGLSREELSKPLKGWRKTAQQPIRYCVRAILFVCGFYWVPTKGKPVHNVPIVVSNHPSVFEPFWFAYEYLPVAVSKAENGDIPIVGTVLRACNTIFVHRTDPNSRKATSNRIKEVTSNREYPPLLIFPEGTNTNGNALISFKLGAFVPGQAIQPCCVKYPFIHHDLSSVGGTGLGWFFYRTQCQFVNYMTITYLPVREPKGVEKSDPALFAKNIRSDMARALNVPTTEHSYEDVLLQMAALKQHLPTRSAVLEYNQAQLKFKGSDMSIAHLKELLAEFAKYDKNHDGQISYKEFLAASSLTDSSITRKMWEFLDVNEDNSVDFREFVTGMALVSGRVNQEDKLKFVWDTFDKSNSGRVSAETFEEIMTTAIPDFTSEMCTTIFKQVDTNGQGYVTYEDFVSFAKNHPVYVQLVLDYHQNKNETQQ